MPRFTPEMRQRFIDESRGKVIAEAEWIEEDSYWVLVFTDGTEMCVRSMAEEFVPPAAPVSDERIERLRQAAVDAEMIGGCQECGLNGNDLLWLLEVLVEQLERGDRGGQRERRDGEGTDA